MKVQPVVFIISMNSLNSYSAELSMKNNNFETRPDVCTEDLNNSISETIELQVPFAVNADHLHWLLKKKKKISRLLAVFGDHNYFKQTIIKINAVLKDLKDFYRPDWQTIPPLHMKDPSIYIPPTNPTLM